VILRTGTGFALTDAARLEGRTVTLIDSLMTVGRDAYNKSIWRYWRPEVRRRPNDQVRTPTVWRAPYGPKNFVVQPFQAETQGMRQRAAKSVGKSKRHDSDYNVGEHLHSVWW
jgi:hypothetical protein